jgi:glycosyltransferase involved in cell wall biosynthesis
MASDPWGGSEELWSRSAIYFAARGFSVCASVHGWSPPHKHVLELMQQGVEVRQRPRESLWSMAQRGVISKDITPMRKALKKLISEGRPDLIVISGSYFPIELIELCVVNGLPFVTICQANSEFDWFDDPLAERYRAALPAALRNYFVSGANQRLTETKIGCDLPNAEVVYNPFNVGINASPPWPPSSELHLACVARLHLVPKGQDILLEALADPIWASRNWRLRLYGDGPNKNTIERLVSHLGLQDRVSFLGYVTVEKIWAENHVLVMPSRLEGLPLAAVEAMLCGRPVVATAVAGFPDIIDDGVTGFLADAPTVPLYGRALNRLWERRSDIEDMGRSAAKRIREKIPADPVRVFSENLIKLI